MPPPARVCQACKASKVRCDDFSPGISRCTRCNRLGLKCEAASSRGMPVAEMFLPRPSSESTESMIGESSSDLSSTNKRPKHVSTAIAKKDCSSYILDLVSEAGSPDVLLFCLRHLVSVARQRSAYEMMQEVIELCRNKRIALHTVLSPSWAFDNGNRTASPHPFELLQLCSSSCGYCLTKTFSPNGTASFYTNAAFENDVLASDACKRCYESNQQCVLSLFLDDDSAARVYSCVASLWLAAAKDSGKLKSSEREELVRVRLQHLGFIACTMRVWILIRREAGYLSITLELTPHTQIPAHDGCSSPTSLHNHELPLLAEPTHKSFLHDGALTGNDRNNVEILFDDDGVGMNEVIRLLNPSTDD